MKSILTPLIVSIVYIFACSASAEEEIIAKELERRDFRIAINKKSKSESNGDKGKSKSAFYEIVARADDKAVPDPSVLKINYMIIYSIGDDHKSEKGTLEFGSDRDEQRKVPLVTKSIKISEESKQNNKRNNNKRNNNKNNNNNKKKEKKDTKITGVVLDIMQDGEIIATFTNPNQLLRKVEDLREEGTTLSAEAFK